MALALRQQPLEDQGTNWPNIGDMAYDNEHHSNNINNHEHHNHNNIDHGKFNCRFFLGLGITHLWDDPTNRGLVIIRVTNHLLCVRWSSNSQADYVFNVGCTWHPLCSSSYFRWKWWKFQKVILLEMILIASAAGLCYLLTGCPGGTIRGWRSLGRVEFSPRFYGDFIWFHWGNEDILLAGDAYGCLFLDK